MRLQDKQWRNGFGLAMVWLLSAFAVIVTAALFWRGMQGFVPSQSYRPPTAFFDELPLALKGILLAVSLALFLPLNVPLLKLLRTPDQRSRSDARLVRMVGLGWLVVLLVAVLQFALPRQEVGQLLVLVGLLGVFAFFDLHWPQLQAAPDDNQTSGPDSAGWPHDRRVFYGLLAAIAVVYGLGAALIPTTWTADTFAYLQNAREVADGQWMVRGHWSPMISWLTGGLMALGATPPLALRLVQGAAGLTLMGGIQQLGSALGLSRVGRLVVAVVSLGLSWHAIRIATPDLLGAVFVVFFWALSLDRRLWSRPWQAGLGMGLLGGLAYLAKSYNLTALLVYLPLWASLLWLHGQRLKTVLQTAAIAAVVMLLVAAPWILAIEARYDVLTVSTAALSPQGMHGPDAEGWFACNDGTLLCDAPDDVLFPWQDHLSRYGKGAAWNPLASAEDVSYWLVMVGSYFHRLYVQHLLAFSWLLVLFLIAALVFWRHPARRFIYGWLFLISFWYPSGYLLVNTVPLRYFYPLFAVYVVGSYLLGRDVVHRIDWSRWGSQRLLHSGLVLVFMLATGLAFFQLGDDLPPSTDCTDELAPYTDLLEAPMVSIEPHNWWNQVQGLAYYTQTRTYGSLAPEFHSLPEMVDTFRAVDAQSVLVSDPAIADELVAGYGYTRRGRIAADEDGCGAFYNFIVLQPPHACPEGRCE